MLDELNQYQSIDQGQTGQATLDPAFANFRDQTRFWIQRVAVPVIMVVGLFGNLITVIIMTRRRMRSTTNMYLAALAFVDMLYLFLTFVLGLSHYPNMAERKYYLYWHLRPFIMMTTDACSNTSVWLTVTFTIERFIAVKYPMKGKVWCTEARAKKLIVSVFVFGLMFASPVPFEWKVIEKRASSTEMTTTTRQSTNPVPDKDGGVNDRVNQSHSAFTPVIVPTELTSNNGDELSIVNSDLDNHNDSIILTLDYSDFGRNETYKTIYYWSTAVIFYFIPLISLTLFNGFLIRSVHRSHRERKRMTNHQSITAHHDRKKSSHLLKQSDNEQTFINNHLQHTEQRGLDRVSRDRVPKIKKSRPVKNQYHNGSGDCSNKMYVCFDNCAKDTNQKSPELHQRLLTLDRGNVISNTYDQSDSISRGAEDTSTESQKQNKHIKLNSFEHIDSCRGLRKACDREEKSTNHNNQIYSHRKRSETAPMPCQNLAASRKAAIADNNSDSIMIKSNDVLPTISVSDINGLVDTDITSGQALSTITLSHHHQQQQQQLPSSVPGSSQERRITIMLIAVVILFLVCQIPSAAMLLYTSVHETIPNTNEHALLLAFGNIFNFLMAVNAAGNFILYSFLSKKYRNTFLILFCSCIAPMGKAKQGDRGAKFLQQQSSYSSAIDWSTNSNRQLVSVRFRPVSPSSVKNGPQTTASDAKIGHDTLV